MDWNDFLRRIGDKNTLINFKIDSLQKQ